MSYKSKYTGKEVESLLDKAEDIPTKTSDLENDSGFITEAAVDGKQDKLKYYREDTDYACLNAIYTEVMSEDFTINASNCTVNVEDGEFSILNGKGYYNEKEIATVEDVATKQDKLSAGNGIEIVDNVISTSIDNNPFIFCEELPTEDINTGKIYCIPNEESTEKNNIWDEYYYANDSWELMGQYIPRVDLEPYAKSADVNAELANKQDKLNYYSEGEEGRVYIKSDNNDNNLTITPYGIQFLYGNVDGLKVQDDGVYVQSETSNIYLNSGNKKAYYNNKEIAVKDDIGGTTLWNTYIFEGSSQGDSIVTIDGENVAIPANAVVQGTFEKDISAIPQNSLKRIVIHGDVSLTIQGSSVSVSDILEEVELEFSADYERSFSYMLYFACGLRKLSIKGGKVTEAYGMFAGIGDSATEGFCAVEIKGMDFSGVTDISYMFAGSAINSLDLSGCNFSSVTTATNMWQYSIINSLNLNGALLPTDATANAQFINSFNNVGESFNPYNVVPAITGSFSKIIGTDNPTIDLSDIDLSALSIMAIFNALENGWTDIDSTPTAMGTLIISEQTYMNLVTVCFPMYDNGWTIVTI